MHSTPYDDAELRALLQPFVDALCDLSAMVAVFANDLDARGYRISAAAIRLDVARVSRFLEQTKLRATPGSIVMDAVTS